MDGIKVIKRTNAKFDKMIYTLFISNSKEKLQSAVMC